MSGLDCRLSVAPMMEWTDRHERYFLRLLSRRTLLYTEMVTTGALLHGDAARHLQFDAAEHPVALQLGGADPVALAECAAMGDVWGYDEINLNVGCPSDRVQAARFGACLMAEPTLVRDAVAAMREATAKPVTVKSRIGVDDRDSYDDLRDFIACVADGGCETFVIHARKALLSGLSPKQNREIPPLHYDFVFRIKQEFPDLTVVLNGGVPSLDAAMSYLDRVDGVMIGRAAYRDPWLLADADRRLFGEPDPKALREDAVVGYLPYVRARLAEGVPLHAMTRHILGLFNGLRGARQWRRFISENAYRPGAGVEVIESALTFVVQDDAMPMRRVAVI
ncbi:MAG: tRNA dihydrouridine(20/20a) synthase DusA [Alphaproteobacteria bacterium]|nr:tRNA dihydrouridine(20/20a) synthase DusA [Alphaproteobacteria bacterium]